MNRTDQVAPITICTLGTALVGLIVVALSLPAHSQSIVPHIEGRCPVGTYRSGDYCKSTHSSERQGKTFIVKNGDRCPIGYYSTGRSYCQQFSDSTETVVPRKDRAKCPTGWYRSGDYCKIRSK